MDSLRQMLHRQVAEALSCATEEEYSRKKAVLLTYLRATQPGMFSLEGGRKRAVAHMAKVEGISVDEKLEDLALTGFLLQQSFKNTSQEEVLATVESCGAPEEDMALLRKIVAQIYSKI
jgi:hypothetical protein